MARQCGVTKLDGKMGDISFYMSKYGPLARTIGVVSKERFHSDPKLALRKAAALDFGYASSMGKLLRVVVGTCCPLAEEGTTNQRLNAVLREALKRDAEHPRGERRMVAGNADALQNFNWREDVGVDVRLKVPLDVVLDPVAGAASLHIPTLVPFTDVWMGDGISHVDIYLVIAAVSRERKTWASVRDVVMIEAEDTSTRSISLNCSLSADSESLWIAGVGVQGYEEVAGQMVAVRKESGFMILESKSL